MTPELARDLATVLRWIKANDPNAPLPLIEDRRNECLALAVETGFLSDHDGLTPDALAWLSAQEASHVAE